MPNAKIGFSKAMSAGWIKMDKKAEGGPRLFKNVGFNFCSISCVNFKTPPHSIDPEIEIKARGVWYLLAQYCIYG